MAPAHPAQEVLPKRGFGDNRDRTGNLRLAKAALSQLSYIPGTARSECPLRMHELGAMIAWWA